MGHFVLTANSLSSYSPCVSVITLIYTAVILVVLVLYCCTAVCISL